GDHALEVEVVEGMVLDVDGQPAGLRIERRPFGDGPTGQDAGDLEPEVVVEPAGPVALHHETLLAARWPPPAPAGRLGGAGEVALGPVGGQLARRTPGRG